MIVSVYKTVNKAQTRIKLIKVFMKKGAKNVTFSYLDTS